MDHTRIEDLISLLYLLAQHMYAIQISLMFIEMMRDSGSSRDVNT